MSLPPVPRGTPQAGAAAPRPAPREDDASRGGGRRFDALLDSLAGGGCRPVAPSTVAAAPVAERFNEHGFFVSDPGLGMLRTAMAPVDGAVGLHRELVPAKDTGRPVLRSSRPDKRAKVAAATADLRPGSPLPELLQPAKDGAADQAAASGRPGSAAGASKQKHTSVRALAVAARKWMAATASTGRGGTPAGPPQTVSSQEVPASSAEASGASASPARLARAVEEHLRLGGAASVQVMAQAAADGLHLIIRTGELDHRERDRLLTQVAALLDSRGYELPEILLNGEAVRLRSTDQEAQ